MANINYTTARALIDANLAAAFADVKASTRAGDTPRSDAAIATIEAWFETPVAAWRDVPVADLAGYMELAGDLYERTQASPVVAAQKLTRILSGRSRVEIFNMSDPDRRAAINTLIQDLVSGGVWTQPEADGAVALAQETVPRWRFEQLGAPVGRGLVLLMKSGRV